MSGEVSSEQNPEQAKLRARLKLGADEELSAMFGPQGTEVASRLRANVLQNGFFTAAEIRDVKAPGLLVITDHDEDIYPAFQFEPGTAELAPQAAVANMCLNTIEGMRAWEVAMWWVSSNGYLDGPTPVEILSDGDPEGLLWDAIYAEVYPSQA